MAETTCLCPCCQSVGIWVIVEAEVDYYRCATCAKVWTLPRDKQKSATEVSPRTTA